MTASMALMAAASEHALLLCCVGGSAARAEWVRGGGIAPASADWPPPASSSMGRLAPTTASGGSNGEPAREGAQGAGERWKGGGWSILRRIPGPRQPDKCALGLGAAAYSMTTDNRAEPDQPLTPRERHTFQSAKTAWMDA